MRLRAILASLALALTSLGAQAETIRVAIGTQDTTINCAAGGLLIRELGLLEKYLPRDGRYKDADYRVEWKNFTSGAPLTNEMVAGKLDFGAMADFPGTFNGVAFAAAGKRSLFISVLSGSTRGSGNGIVVPSGSPVQSLAELKGQTISVPFASTAHGMLLRAVAAQGWDPQRDVTIIAQPPEIAGSALQANKIAAHADFVPFAELFPNRGFARKIYDGSQANAPTFHGALVDAAYAERYPEVVVAYLRASIEANRLLAAEPEKYSELIEKVTGIEAEVNYLFHGPLGLQTRDQAWKPEYRQALASDARSGRPIEEFERVAQIWVKGEARVRHYASPESALADLAELKAQGKAIRAIYAQDRDSGIKLLANQAWFVRDGEGRLNAFLLREQAQDYARRHGGEVRDFAAASQQALALR
ncbi:nitrate ABC transporter substrate-binding protein [Pseudomonas aeruginosa]|nr:nitrate ABC transporter substrate-binding protein [Pseudomonas aeruginosa]MCO3860866.1 nitrate ABC transporter substrate-binding protein [Pseudomonas aeruginosa]